MGVVSAILLATLLGGIWRIAQGPTVADRVLGLQMSGTTGIALLLVLAEWQQFAPLRDVSAVLALLAAVLSIALVQILRSRNSASQERNP